MCSLINGTDFFALRAFEFLITNIKITIPKIYIFFLSPTLFFFYSFPTLPYLFHPSYLPSVFIQYFSLFLSLISLHPFHMCSIGCVSSYHFLHLLFSPSSGISSVTPLILLCPDSFFFPFFLACLCLCLFYLALHSSIFLLLLIFPFLHWHIRFSDSIFFFSLQHSTSILHSSLPSSLVTTVTPKE
jgi:hypothetical protein